MRTQAVHSVLSLVAFGLVPLHWPGTACGQKFVVDKPVTEYASGDKKFTPEQAAADLAVPDDLAVSLVAAEPETADPVAIAFDEDLRLFVAEMATYPDGSPDGDREQGRIRQLNDLDGDGRYETSTIFVDKLGYPTSVLPWDDGIYVTSAPNVWYFKDTDGDGRADEKRVVFEGFGVWNPQHQTNGLHLSLDNWVLLANGDSAGEITSPKFPGEAVSIRRRDFRFRPGTEQFEAMSGQGQYGVALDDWGRRFWCNNRAIFHEVVLRMEYLKRNPYLTVTRPHTNVCEHGETPQVYPRSEQTARWIDLTHLGYITSACGVQIYRGALLPEAYRGNAFVCEPVANLVVRLTLDKTDQPVVSARRARENVEFLTSTDPWSRPVYIANGPDGALYVVDMVRQIIEHTKWIPEEVQKAYDVQAGNDRGRIYRIAPKGWKYQIPPRLGDASTAKLVDFLTDPNGWRRDTAQRLLLTRKDPAAIPLLRKVARSSQVPQGRVHALWTLDAQDGIDEATLAGALRDPHPRVRENAVRVAEKWFDKSKRILDQATKLADDADARLRFQVALSLGATTNAKATDALARIADRDGADEWVRSAILTSVAERCADLLERLAAKNGALLKTSTPEGRTWVRELARIIGTRQQDAEIAIVLRLTQADGSSPPWWRAEALDGLGQGLARGKTPKVRLPNAQPFVLRMLSDPSVEVQQAGQRISAYVDMRPSPEQAAVVNRAIKTALDEKHPLDERVQAATVLGYGELSVVTEPLASLLQPRQPRQLQSAATTALANFRDEDAALLLIEHWPSLGPAVQKQALDVLIRRNDWVGLLLAAVKDETVPAFAFDAMRRDTLLRHPNEAVNRRAADLFKPPSPAETEMSLATFGAAVQLEGHVDAGGKVFVKLCATCHKIGDVGNVVGPDLTGVKGRSKEALLIDILAPNRALAPGYVNYLVETTRGEVLSGIVVSESFGSVTLAKADGATEVILRQNIADMRSSKLSLMPEGLVKDLRPPDMADLLAYLKALPSKKGAAGYWRLEHDGADSAGAVSDAAVVGIGENNRPRFIDDVPARWIHDPLTGATQQNTGAVRFDGKDDYLRLGNGDSTDLDSDALTVAQTFEAFVRLDAPVTGGTHAGLLLGKWNQVTDGGDHLALFLHGDGSIQCGAQASRTWFEETHNSGAGGKLEVGKWHHVAGVYQYDVGKREATVTVYQDYKVVSTTSYEARGPLRRARISYQLGGEGDAESGGIRFVAATFDEVRISDAVLTPEEFLRAGDAPASK